MGISGSILWIHFIMELRKRTIFQTIFSGDIPLYNRPYIWNRYLQSPEAPTWPNDFWDYMTILLGGRANNHGMEKTMGKNRTKRFRVG